jgi:hypothetical protein
MKTLSKLSSSTSLRALSALAGLGALAAACSAAPGDDVGRTELAVTTYGAVAPSSPSAWGAADLENAYLVPVARQANATIAVIAANDSATGDVPTLESDLAQYRSAYGLAPCTSANGCFLKLNENGADSPLPAPAMIGYGAGEAAAAAVDMASAGCPTCKILVVDLNAVTTEDYSVAISTAGRLGAKTVILTGADTICPPGSLCPSLDAMIASSGVTAFVAPIGWKNGNGETAGGALTSLANVVNVGCTSLANAGNNAGARFGWSDVATSACGTYSACDSSAKPAWQHDALCSGRTDVDVAATGGPVWTFSTFGAPNASADPGWMVQTSTVVAASLAAGIFAQSGNGGAASSYPYTHAGSFFDVTSGAECTGTGCSGGLYNAASGYDGPTGIGVPNAMALAGLSASPLLTQTLDRVTIEQNQASVAVELQASATGWTNPASIAFAVSGLPDGVTAKWVQTGSYIPPVQGIEGAIEFSASATATLGEQRTVTITATSGTVSATAQVEVIEQGTCTPTPTCTSGQCGNVSNGCGTTVYCGSCGGLTCPKGQHNCGGYCSPYVCN